MGRRASLFGSILRHGPLRYSDLLTPDVDILPCPHERYVRSSKHLAKLVEDTVWHEVAHYFGMDELQVRAAERARKLSPKTAATKN